MSHIIFLDTGPLGVLTNPKKPPDTVDALRWAADQIRAGNQRMVPSIADYEVRRELERLKGITGIASLDAWNSIPTDRYVHLIVATSNVGHLSLFLAADFWRNISL
jgi:hypothetical protein